MEIFQNENREIIVRIKYYKAKKIIESDILKYLFNI